MATSKNDALGENCFSQKKEPHNSLVLTVVIAEVVNLLLSIGTTNKLHQSAKKGAPFLRTHSSNPPLFRNKRFALNEMFQRNASKFSIFYV